MTNEDEGEMTVCDACGVSLPLEEADECGCGQILCPEHAAPDKHDCKA